VCANALDANVTLWLTQHELGYFQYPVHRRISFYGHGSQPFLLIQHDLGAAGVSCVKPSFRTSSLGHFAAVGVGIVELHRQVDDENVCSLMSYTC